MNATSHCRCIQDPVSLPHMWLSAVPSSYRDKWRDVKVMEANSQLLAAAIFTLLGLTACG